MRDCRLTFGSKDAKITAYTDADYTQQSDHHLISGYYLQFGASTISWSLKKQNIVALLSTEAKYIGHTCAVKEISWIWNFWAEIDRKLIFNLILLKANNQGAIELSNNNKSHTHIKHISVCYHFIHKAFENRSLDIQYVPTDENVMDIFTKALARPLPEKSRWMLEIHYTWGGVLKSGQACFYSWMFFIYFSFTSLSYPTIDSASSSYLKLRHTLNIYSLSFDMNQHSFSLSYFSFSPAHSVTHATLWAYKVIVVFSVWVAHWPNTTPVQQS